MNQIFLIYLIKKNNKIKFIIKLEGDFIDLQTVIDILF